MLAIPPMKQRISVVLPAYNECEALPLVIADVLAVLREEGVGAEVLVIDDGSTDNTRQTMVALASNDDSVRYLRLSRNFGKEAALSAGLAAATGDAVILMDSDGQHPPALIKEMLSHWRAGSQVVCYIQEHIREFFMRRQARRGYYYLLEIGSSIRIPPNAGDFRLLDRKVVEALNRLPERSRLMKGLYAWVGFRVEYLTFTAPQRIAGATKYNWLRLFGLAFTGLTSFTVVPLRLISVAGMLVSLLSIFYGCYVVFEHYAWNQPAGWATPVVGIMFLSGVQLMALGIIAEYVGRTFEEVKQRPLYIVAEDTREVSAATEAHRVNAPERDDNAG